MVTTQAAIAPEELGLDSMRFSSLDAHLQEYGDEGKPAGALVPGACHGQFCGAQPRIVKLV